MTAYRLIATDGGQAVAAWKASGNLRPFVRRLLDLQRAHPDSLHAVAWDAPRAEGWRRKRSAEYKAKREAPDQGLHAALEALRADLPALDVMQFSAPTAEADDVLYSLSVQTPGPILLVSADKDLRQAVRPGVHLLRPAGKRGEPDELITAESQKPAAWWTSFLTLAGDPVDGIPGLPGVGKKRAEEILEGCPGFVDLLLTPCPECGGRGTVQEGTGYPNGEGGEEWREVCCPRCGGDCADVAGLLKAREQCNAHSATLAKWVERAIFHLPDLRLSRELVTLRAFDLECIEAEPDAERAGEVLRAARLEGV